MKPSNPTEPKMLNDLKPFAWMVRAENGYTIIWTRNFEQGRTAAAKHGRPLEALYAEPPRSSPPVDLKAVVEVLDREELTVLISDAISDSIDMDWTASIGARHVVDALVKEGIVALKERTDAAQ